MGCGYGIFGGVDGSCWVTCSPEPNHDAESEKLDDPKVIVETYWYCMVLYIYFAITNNATRTFTQQIQLGTEKRKRQWSTILQNDKINVLKMDGLWKKARGPFGWGTEWVAAFFCSFYPFLPFDVERHIRRSMRQQFFVQSRLHAVLVQILFGHTKPTGIKLTSPWFNGPHISNRKLHIRKKFAVVHVPVWGILCD